MVHIHSEVVERETASGTRVHPALSVAPKIQGADVSETEHGSGFLEIVDILRHVRDDEVLRVQKGSEVRIALLQSHMYEGS